jgi:hypothetical protein
LGSIFGLIGGKGVGEAINLAIGGVSADKTNLIDDITTSFTRKANEIQKGTSLGKIQRVQEMQLLGQLGLEDLLETIQYRDNLKSQISALEAKQIAK